jgi:hypothetical protein
MESDEPFFSEVQRPVFRTNRETVMAGKRRNPGVDLCARLSNGG